MTSTQFPDILSKPVVQKKQPEVKRAPVSKKVFWKLFRSLNPEFQITEGNQQIVFSIFRYFLKQQNFNEFGTIKNKPGLDRHLKLIAITPLCCFYFTLNFPYAIKTA